MNVTKQGHCRFCAEQNAVAEMIIMSTDILPEVYEKLTYLGVSYVDFSDKTLPKTVCANCFDFLNSAYDYFIKVKLSQGVLHSTYSQIYCSFKTEDSDQNEFVNVFEESKPPIVTDTFVINCVSTDCFPTWETYLWMCKFCNKEFKTIENIRQHSKKLHRACLCFKCYDCKESDFNSYDIFIEHIRKHRPELSKYCSQCNVKLEIDESCQILHNHNQFTCNECGEMFDGKSSLLNHIEKYKNKVQQDYKVDASDVSCSGSELIDNDFDDELFISWDNYTWTCRHCKACLPDKETLRDHSEKNHGSCFGFSCVDCDSNLKDFKEFVKHVRHHHPILNLFCEYCNSRHSNFQSTVRHSKKHKLNRKHCKLCGEIFKTKKERQNHVQKFNEYQFVKKERRKAPITKQDLICQVCNKKFKDLPSLKRHENIHKERKREHTCEVCGKAFYEKNCLLKHHEIHENLKQQTCHICQKGFLNQTRLKKHMQIHLEKLFQCATCFKRFGDKWKLKSHMIVHTDLLPYECDFCDKKFRFQNTWKIHQHQHTGAKPYSCKICSMTFANQSNRNKHVKRRHGGTKSSSLGNEGDIRTGNSNQPEEPGKIDEWPGKLLQTAIIE